MPTCTQRKGHVRIQWKATVCKPGREASVETKSADTLILDFQLPELQENKVLLCKLLSPWCFVLATPANKCIRPNLGVCLVKQFFVSYWSFLQPHFKTSIFGCSQVFKCFQICRFSEWYSEFKERLIFFYMVSSIEQPYIEGALDKWL